MNRRRGSSLIGVIVAVVIVLVATLVFTFGGFGLTGKGAPQRNDKVGKTLVGRSIARAKDEVCMSNLSQLRQAIEIASDPNDNTRPASIQDTRLGSDFYKCPIGAEPYDYDSQTGKVSCPHPGHEKY